MTIQNQIKNAFSGIVGQSRIVEILMRAAFAALAEGNLQSFLFTGLAGLGKTHLLTAYIRALDIVAKELHKVEKQSVFVTSPEAFRLANSSEFATVKSAIMELRPLILGVDEFHELSTGYMGPTKRAVSRFIKEALDGASENGRVIRFGDSEETTHVSRKTVSINCATNFPAMLKDADAQKRRFDAILALDLMTTEEIAQVTQLMLQKRGIRCNNDTTLMTIARCGRGTCELPENISRTLESIARVAGKDTVNRDEVLEALRSLQRYPRGLSRAEMRMLESSLGIFQRETSLAIVLGIEAKAVKQSAGFLHAQYDSETGKHTPFIEMKGSQIRATKAGADFLEHARKARFVW